MFAPGVPYNLYQGEAQGLGELAIGGPGEAYVLQGQRPRQGNRSAHGIDASGVGTGGTWAGRGETTSRSGGGLTRPDGLNASTDGWAGETYRKH